MFENTKKFITLTDMAQAIRDCDASWEAKFDLIFSNDLNGAVRATGICFDYYDPDGSYEDDVRAYVRALVDKADDFKKALRAVEDIDEED